jgi:hypothetical protein
MMRADQVRVHHKRTKHEYVFRVAGNHLDGTPPLRATLFD